VVVPAIKEWWVIKLVKMSYPHDRDLLVLFKTQFMSQQAMEQEVDCINKIISSIELPHQFCKAHELVRRNRITHNSSKIMAAFRQRQLKPFWFLISKN
jgi:hypothetical protein